MSAARLILLASFCLCACFDDPSQHRRVAIPDLAPRPDLAKPADLLPPVDLAPPPIPSGPLGEFEKIPDWANQDTDDGTALKVFSRSPAVVADVLKDARVVCQILATSHFDTFKGADLTVEARIGAAPRIVHRGWNDYGSAEVLVPVQELRVGDEMTFIAVDRDVFSNEPMGQITGKYEGRFPQKFDADHFKVNCHAMTRAQGESELSLRLAALNTAIAKLRLQTVPKDRDFGRGQSGIPLMLAALEEAAGFVGWTHPRIQERSDIVAKHLKAWDAACEKTLRRITSTLPPVGEPAEIKGIGRFRALPPRCPPPRQTTNLSAHERIGIELFGCLVEIEVTPVAPLAIDDYMCRSEKYKRPHCLQMRPRLVLANGRTVEPKIISLRKGAEKSEEPRLLTELEAGATYVLTFEPRMRIAAPPDPRRPVLLEWSFGTVRLD